MLTKSTRTTVDGLSMTEENEQVASFYATLDAPASIHMNITNQALYEKHKAMVRKDKREFDDYVYSLEDAGE